MKKSKSSGSRRAKKSDAAGVAKAFLHSGAHTFLDKKLQPYTPSRVVAAQAMGLLYPNIDKEGLAQLKKRGIYPGELKDMIIVLWLCRLDKDEEVQEALADPIAAYGAAEKWAGKAGLCDMTSQVFMYGIALFQIIMGEIGDSKTVPAGERSRPADNDEEGPDPND